MIADDSGATDNTDFTTTEPISEGIFDQYEFEFETYNRTFVSDLPWHQRFLIWLFPRMYHLEDYPVE